MDKEKSAMNAAVAAELRAERGAQSMTIAQLSHGSGVPIATLNRALAGERDINVTQLGKIAFALNVDPQVILRKAVERAGGLDIMFQASDELSAAADNVTPIRKRVEDMTVEEIEAIEEKAAVRDEELNQDEQYD